MMSRPPFYVQRTVAPPSREGDFLSQERVELACYLWVVKRMNTHEIACWLDVSEAAVANRMPAVHLRAEWAKRQARRLRGPAT